MSLIKWKDVIYPDFSVYATTSWAETEIAELQSSIDLKCDTTTFTTLATAIDNDLGVINTTLSSKADSTTTQSALDAKQATLVSGTNIKTVLGQDLLGTGNIVPAGLTFTGAVTASYDGTTATTVNIPSNPTRVKSLFTGSLDLAASGTAYTPAVSATAISTQSNATIKAHLTFLPDSGTFLLSTLLNLIVNTLSQGVTCEFLVNGTVVDTKSGQINRSGRSCSMVFETCQNLTAADVVTIRLTPTFTSGADLEIPASVSANFITIS